MWKQEGRVAGMMEEVIAVTNRRLCERPFLEQIARVCELHPRALILREKDLTETAYCELARDVLAVCTNYEVECILHSYPAVAVKLGQKALHLSLPQLKEWKEKQRGEALFKKLGCSVHSVEEAVLAEELGATYLTAGHIYETDCKVGVPPRGLTFLEKVCKQAAIPVYAIGGIGISDGRIEEVMRYGAAGACVMSGMMRV